MRRDAPELYLRTNTSVVRGVPEDIDCAATSVDDSISLWCPALRYAKRPEPFRQTAARESSPPTTEEEEMNTGTVREAMTASPTTVEAHDTAVEAARLMAAQNVGSLPVVEGKELVGMVTDRDLVLNVLAKDVDPHKVTVASICSENPVVVGPEDSLDVALQHMAREQIRRLPVVEEQRLIGILAQADVSRTVEPAATGRMVEEISAKNGEVAES
jgi:CBS domain-containing protein